MEEHWNFQEKNMRFEYFGTIILVRHLPLITSLHFSNQMISCDGNVFDLIFIFIEFLCPFNNNLLSNKI